jgi:ubiquinone biosynthesis protein UbiJ
MEILMMLLSFVLPLIEKSINHFLQLDPESSKRLLKLSGKVIAIELTYSKQKIYFVVDGNYVQLFDRHDANPDVILHGTPFDFLRLSLTQNSGPAIFSGNLNINGRPEVAQQFKQVFAELEIDWEEQLSRVTGDVVAYQIGKVVRAFSQWAQQTNQTFQQNFTEYLQEEIALLPPRMALQDFFAEVDEARDAAERLAFKITRLKNRYIQES